MMGFKAAFWRELNTAERKGNLLFYRYFSKAVQNESHSLRWPYHLVPHRDPARNLRRIQKSTHNVARNHPKSNTNSDIQIFKDQKPVAGHRKSVWHQIKTQF